MANNIVKKQTNEKRIRTIILVALYAVLAVFIVFLFIFNSRYTDIYKSPKVHNGKVDFNGVDLPSRGVACNLNGEWEFFYNKWIVTDNEDCAPDGMIRLPDVWTYKDYGNGRLPRTGYASYRLYAENVQQGVDIVVYRYYSNVAYRVFINGQLNLVRGVISKNESEMQVTGNIDESRTFRTDGSPIEIVIEVSASNIGGFNAAPWLAATYNSNYGMGMRAFSFAVIGVSTAAVVISILSFVFFKYKRDWTAPAFILALYAHFLTSKDLFYVFGNPSVAAMITELLSALITFALLAVHFYKNGAVLKKAFVIPTAISVAVFTALLIGFYGTPLAPVFAYLIFAAGCAYLVPLVFNRKFTSVQYVVYGILFVFLMSIFFFEFADALGLLVFGTEFIFTFELMLVIGCFTVLWLWKLAKAARVAMRVSELECELSTLQNQALREQIKPHFIYNSLTAIQAQYREGLCEGDKAIEQFAVHLRLITDSNGAESVPFEDEVRNVLNYFELENLRADGTLELLLDLNYTDFKVPVLSLQPLVENAIRHGGLREKQDGYITLSSDKADGAVVITVSDNGKGFDVNAVHAGVGLENTRKRFASIHAKMTVESKLGFGTKITIEIPLE